MCYSYVKLLFPGSTLICELKKQDNKALLVEVQLLESKVYHAMGDLPKAQVALTSAKKTAKTIFCPSKLKAALNLMSGERMWSL